MAKDIAAFGLYPNRSALEGGIDALRAAGFRASDISVLMPDSGSTKDLGHEIHSKAPEGAAAGAGTGAVLGGVLGMLVGAGTLVIPGLGPLIAAGPIVAALAGAGAAGTTGGLIGALIGLGVPEIEAKRYEGRVRGGKLLCSVHCDDSEWADRARGILERTGAEEVTQTSEATADYHP